MHKDEVNASSTWRKLGKRGPHRGSLADASPSTPMKASRGVQQGAAALACMAYVGYVGYNRFASQRETAVQNAKERGRRRAEARLRKLEAEGKAFDNIHGEINGRGSPENPVAR